MKAIYIYKSDSGCRKGYHPVCRLYAERKEIKDIQYFSVDEPGAWFDDCWNCHVDGMDFACATRDEAIEKGIRFWDSESDYKVYYEES